MQFDFQIPMAPVAKGRPRFTRSGHTYTPPKTRRAEQDIRYFLSKEFLRAPLEGPLKVFARFTFILPKSVKRKHVTVKPDLSNLFKCLEDAGNGILWNDDSLIVYSTLEKTYGSVPSIYLHVSELDI